MALLKHNVTVYKELEEKLQASDNALLIHGTGMGKSFILLEHLMTLSKDTRVLYVVPKTAIIENFTSYKEYEELKVSVDFCTYNKFASEEIANETLDQYDLFIFDEAHHLGSDLYGKNALIILNTIKKGCNKKVIGLTATNRREDGIDIADYFSETILGVSILEGIRQGLIPPFEYLICGNDAVDQLGVGEKITDYRQIIEYEEALPLLSETIEKNLKKKWICFFTNINELEIYENFIKSMFPDDYKVIKISSRHDTSISEVFDHDKVVILSVDKLIEGIHLPNIEGILLFRKVGSLPVFQQILGRLVHVGSPTPPLILDCTETAFQLLGKLMAGEKKAGYSTDKRERNNGSVRDILYCSIQNIEHFDLEQLLLEYNKNGVFEFEFRGELFTSLSKCCIQYNINPTKVYNYAFNHKVSHQDALEHFLLGNFEFRGEKYDSFTACCNKYCLNQGVVTSHARRKNISKQEAIEYYLTRQGKFEFQGKRYTSLKACCDELCIKVTKIYDYSHKNNVSHQEALEYFLAQKNGSVLKRGNFKFRNKWYTSFKECCLEYNLPYQGVVFYHNKHNISKQDALEHYLFIKQGKFQFRGKWYKSCIACCKKYDLNINAITNYSRRHKISKQEAIEFYLKRAHNEQYTYQPINSKSISED